MKDNGIENHSRDHLASLLNDIRNNNNWEFYYDVSKVFRYESAKNSIFDDCTFDDYIQNAYDTIRENGWYRVLNRTYVGSYYYDKILEVLSLYQFDYNDKKIIEKAKTI